MVRSRVLLAAAALILLPAPSRAATFEVRPLVSNGVVPTSQPPDPQLLNAWGVSFPPGGPMWVSDNGAGVATLYDGRGTKQGLVVSMPGGAPITGQVFNSASATSFNHDLFLFAAENGGIYGWRPALGTAAETLKSPSSDVYKGLALSGASLIAANFNTGKLDVFSGLTLGAPQSFADPAIPAGFAPFNVQALGGKVFVTFAMQDAAKHDDVPGPGNGFVDVFDPATGKFTRLISNGALNSPWGLAIAPSTFDQFAGDLLVGNFGDGTINAFNPTTGAFVGTLMGPDGNPLVIDGLWALTAGSGSATAPTSTIFFTAGPNSEADGIFGALVVVPEPATAALFLVGGAGLLLWRRRKARPA